MTLLLQVFIRFTMVSAMLLVTAWSAAAQTVTQAAAQTSLPADKVYVYVEKMPQLPGGGGMLAIVTAIQQHISYPVHALRAHAEGRVYVSFTVAASGLVENVAITRSFRPDCDSAVVGAVKQLPLFEPGQQVGKPVPVSFTVPVTFRLPSLQPPAVKPVP